MAIFKQKFQTPARELFASLDIGSSKVYCAIARISNAVDPDSGFPEMRVIGFGQHLSRGIKNGNITDLEQLEDSLLNAIHTAEQVANRNISNVYVNLSGSTLQHQILKTEIPINGRPIDDTHIKKMLNTCRDTVPSNTYVVHAIPITYTLDELTGVKDPRGMTCDKLTAEINVVTAPVTLVKNIVACVGRCQLDVAGFVAAPYATGLATLVPDELQLGATVIDFGGGSTSYAAFTGGNFINMGSIPVGGNNITTDISRVLSTPLSQAERLKNLYGSLFAISDDDGESIIIPQMGEVFNAESNHISKGILTKIIKSRVEETLELLKKKMLASYVDPSVFQRFVITGGTSQIAGFRELASHILGGQVRIATPLYITGSSEMLSTPMFSTSAGILLHAYQDMSDMHTQNTQTKSGTWGKISNWVRENF